MNKTKPIKFLIIGRTASGKSSIARAVCNKLGLQLVKSYTTRPPREEEKKMSSKDTDHYFIDDMYMDEFISYDEIAAYTEINGYKYFVTKDILDKSDIYVIDPIGVDDLEKRCGDEYKFIKIYIRVNEQVAKQRFISRGGTVEEFLKDMKVNLNSLVDMKNHSYLIIIY